MNGTADITMADASETAGGASAVAPPPTRTPSPPPALAPGTLSSTLPGVEDLLELIYGVAEGEEVGSERVVEKAKEVAAQLAQMKAAAMGLPGGHLGADAVTAVTRVLEEEARRKRDILLAFANTPTPIADQLAESGSGTAAVASATATQ